MRHNHHMVNYNKLRDAYNIDLPMTLLQNKYFQCICMHYGCICSKYFQMEI